MLTRSLLSPALWLFALLIGAALAGTYLIKPPPPAQGAKLALGVLGDSDSHSYGDEIWFPDGSGSRGGRFHASTLQWTEVLQKLRGNEIELGEWGIWGVPRAIARAVEAIGLGVVQARVKQDFRFNLAVSGATCGALSSGNQPQAKLLSKLIASDPQRWESGVVVMRIGINSMGRKPQLDLFAKTPSGRQTELVVGACIDDIARAMKLIRGASPSVRIVLIGIFDNADWAPYHAYWHSPEQLANIAAVLDRFDRALVDMARLDGKASFFSDRQWFRQRWGGRDAEGKPAYRDVVFARRCRIANTSGDTSEHAHVADGHAGTAWNGLWAQSLVEHLRQEHQVPVHPISEEEVAALLAKVGADTGCHAARDRTPLGDRYIAPSEGRFSSASLRATPPRSPS